MTALEYRSFATLMSKSKVPLHAVSRSSHSITASTREDQIPAAVLKLIVSIFAALVVLLLLLFRRPLQNQSNLVKYETDRQRVNQQIFSEIKQNHYLSLKAK